MRFKWPSRGFVSDVIELLGLATISASVWGLAGQWWGILAAGISAVVYGVAMETEQ